MQIKEKQPGTAINIEDVNKKANNPGTGIDSKQNWRVYDLCIDKDIANSNRRTNNLGISINSGCRQKNR